MVTSEPVAANCETLCELDVMFQLLLGGLVGLHD